MKEALKELNREKIAALGNEELVFILKNSKDWTSDTINRVETEMNRRLIVNDAKESEGEKSNGNNTGLKIAAGGLFGLSVSALIVIGILVSVLGAIITGIVIFAGEAFNIMFG